MTGVQDAIGRMAAFVTALVVLGGATIAVVNWAEGSADEIVPRVLAGVALVYFSLVGIAGSVFLIRGLMGNEEYKADLGTWATSALIAIAALVVMLLLENFVTTLTDGRYEDNSVTVAIFGSVGLAILLLVIGLMLRTAGYARRQPGWAPRGRKVCPDCAEFPRQHAKVCHFCGYRFS